MAMKKESGASSVTRKLMRQIGPGKKLVPASKKQNLVQKRKKDTSYSTVEKNRLVSKPRAGANGGPGGKVSGRSVSTGKSNPGSSLKHKGSHPNSGGKRSPGYKGEGPYNISGPGSRIPKKPSIKRKPAPMPTPGGTRKPNPKKTGEPGTAFEGMLLLSTKKSKSSAGTRKSKVKK